MKTPYGNLRLVRRYTCGCAEYRDERGELFKVDGLYCDGQDAYSQKHKATIAEGAEEQDRRLF